MAPVAANMLGQSVTATLKKYAALVPMDTSVFMLAERWRSSVRNPAWNCQPTQNWTGVVRAQSRNGSRNQ
jgi:hypothetical protein